MNPEKPSASPEKKDTRLEVEQAAAEQEQKIGERLSENAERRDKSPERGAEKARDDALELAEERQETAAETTPDTERQPSPAARRIAGKAEHEASFNTTMDEVQGQMSTPSRAFSKVIHNKAVEKMSEVTGSTIARPNALLSGAIFAFILTLAVYLVARNIGYPLSGSESIGAFIIGWIIGILYDFLKVMVTGRK